jgi:hypothetical protein
VIFSTVLNGKIIDVSCRNIMQFLILIVVV